MIPLVWYDFSLCQKGNYLTWLTSSSILNHLVLSSRLFLLCYRIPNLPWDTTGVGGMKSCRYHLELLSTDICTKIFVEETKGVCQRALKGSTRVCFLFYSWLMSKKSAEAAASIGVELISTVKTNTTFFQGYDRGVNKILAWRVLHGVKEQAYSTRGKFATLYCLQVKFL